MIIKLIRRFRGPQYCIGDIYVNGKFTCNCMEPFDAGITLASTAAEVKKLKKKYGKICIAPGMYNLSVTYSPAFKKNLILVNGTTGFSGIRIHAGNTIKDTKGCILPGINSIKGMVVQSKVYTEAIQDKVEAALAKGEEVTLHVVKR